MSEASRARISIWSVPLAPECPPWGALDCLSVSERERAHRFRFESDRRRFALSHAALRHVLGNMVGIPPAELTFAESPRGKPELAAPFAGRIYFNLSHCDSLALVAVAWECPIGVDVERIRIVNELEAISRLLFSSAELGAVLAAEPRDRHRVFFRYWTRKEALIKATGTGLTDSLSELDTFTESDAGAVRLTSVEGEASTWTVQTLSVSPGHVAAVAASATELRVEHHPWTW